MEIVISVVGVTAAVFVVIFGGRGLLDLVRGAKERRRARVGGGNAVRPKPLHQDVRFTTTPDGVRLAYSTSGTGPPLVKIAPRLTHLEFDWESPVWGPWWRELSRDHTLIRYDQRGSGLSDWDVDEISLDAWVVDTETVVDTLGLDRFVLFGQSQSGSVAAEYAARHPERVTHLVLLGTPGRGRSARGEDPAVQEALWTLIRAEWGKNNPAIRQIFSARTMPGANAEQIRWLSERERVSGSAENVVRFAQATRGLDTLARASAIKVPTLVCHSRDDGAVPFEEGRRLAAAIPNARFVALNSENHVLLDEEPAWSVLWSEFRHFVGVES